MTRQGGLDPLAPPGVHLISAFLAMEPADSLISLSRQSGGGLVTEEVQRFIWDHCITQSANKGGWTVYLRNFVKKLIYEVESNGGAVLDELYEQCGCFMASAKDNGNGRVCKCISFLFPQDSCELPVCPSSGKLVVPLYCSLNMLEGDTGCTVWPSSLYLSEFILSFPHIFSNKSCFEVGSGVGLVGICLSHVKASKVILSDGDLSTLANMKLNLELSQFGATADVQDMYSQDQNVQPVLEVEGKSQLKLVHLPWGSATESELQDFTPDIILGADVIYDPSCLPDLVRVVAILLSTGQTRSSTQKLNSSDGVAGDVDSERKSFHDNINIESDWAKEPSNGSLNGGSRKNPVAYIASVIRNIDTFEFFLKLSEQANLVVTDLTETLRPFNFLPYMQSYDRKSIRLFRVSLQ